MLRGPFKRPKMASRSAAAKAANPAARADDYGADLRRDRLISGL